MSRKFKILALVVALAAILGIVGGTVYAAGSEICDDVSNCFYTQDGSGSCH